MTTDAIARLDGWLSDEFVALNTELEETYFTAGLEHVASPALALLAEQILFAGAKLAEAVLAEDALPDAADDRYRLLGSVGMHLAACRRHRVDEPHPDVLAPAWSLAQRLAGPLGVAPRMVFAHQGVYGFRTFTSLPDERLFVARNADGVLAYQVAADALRRVEVAEPASARLLATARYALDDVLAAHRALAAELDVERFFRSVRPYFKTYRVGAAEHRGTNAGDFAAINEIDLLLGVCRADDPRYRRVLEEKVPYVPPEDQAVLRAASGIVSILDRFRHALPGGGETLRANAELFLAVCRAHGAAASFHHHRLVLPFLAEPARAAPVEPEDLTASGPPLDVVLDGLQWLSDLRAARSRPGMNEPRASLERLRGLLDAAPGVNRCNQVRPAWNRNDVPDRPSGTDARGGHQS